MTAEEIEKLKTRLRNLKKTREIRKKADRLNKVFGNAAVKIKINEGKSWYEEL